MIKLPSKTALIGRVMKLNSSFPIRAPALPLLNPTPLLRGVTIMPLPAKLRSTLDGFRQLPGSRCNLQDSTRGEGPRGVYCTRLGRAECQDCAAAFNYNTTVIARAIPGCLRL